MLYCAFFLLQSSHCKLEIRLFDSRCQISLLFIILFIVLQFCGSELSFFSLGIGTIVVCLHMSEKFPSIHILLNILVILPVVFLRNS